MKTKRWWTGRQANKKNKYNWTVYFTAFYFVSSHFSSFFDTHLSQIERKQTLTEKMFNKRNQISLLMSPYTCIFHDYWNPQCIWGSDSFTMVSILLISGFSYRRSTWKLIRHHISPHEHSLPIFKKIITL